jgi:hypothetical protein
VADRILVRHGGFQAIMPPALGTILGTVLGTVLGTPIAT